MATPRKVFVGCPLAGEDAALVGGWATAFRALAPGEGVVFHLCAALQASDVEAAAACEAAGVSRAMVPPLPLRRGGALSLAESQKNAAALALQRTRLVREALGEDAQVVWFVAVGVRVTPEIWGGVDALLREGIPIVVVPTAGLGALPPPPRVLAVPGDKLTLCDPRHLSALAPGEGVPILGGGMGCTAVALWAALQVRFVFGCLCMPEEETTLAGEDVGFFYGALKAGLAVRVPPGLGGALCPGAGPGGGSAPG